MEGRHGIRQPSHCRGQCVAAYLGNPSLCISLDNHWSTSVRSPYLICDELVTSLLFGEPFGYTGFLMPVLRPVTWGKSGNAGLAQGWLQSPDGADPLHLLWHLLHCGSGGGSMGEDFHGRLTDEGVWVPLLCCLRSKSSRILSLYWVCKSLCEALME